nr:MBOAT family O-acyltransferase [uncultured Carboxylicivirga sp.]
MQQLITWIESQSDLFLFTQTGFWVFYAIVLLINALVCKNRILRSSFLFVASLYFYYKTGGYFFTLLIISTIVDYSIGLFLGKAHNKYLRKLLVLFSLLINLGVLAYFKYTYFILDLYSSVSHQPIKVFDFLANEMNKLAGTGFNIDSITLPVGISFFTFQTISYTIDVYRKELKPVRNIIDFGFYVSFFPQLIAGPIVRARTFIPQIYKRFVVSNKWMWWSFLWILGGLFKKMVISDYISVNFVDRVFEHPIAYSGFEVLMAVYGYALQIYCDFSGYTDIAMGVALLLGFRLPINFNYPYKATSIRDFWRRWHISLSSWLRDYLYIPLGGNKGNAFRTGFNLMLTMLLGGLWHGAALKFVVWGGLHGMGLVFNRMVNRIWKIKGNKLSRLISWFFTFHFVVFTWIVFRVESLESAEILITRLFRAFMPNHVMDVVLSQTYLFLLILFGFIIHFIPSMWHHRGKLFFLKLPLLVKLIVSASMIYIIIQLHQSDILPFIYFRF